VNADCTGTATVQFFEAGNLVRTSVLSLVFDNNLREIRMAQKSLTPPNNVVLPVVITVEARKCLRKKIEEDRRRLKRSLYEYSGSMPGRSASTQPQRRG
jgi:hypothetical protein